MSIYLQRVMQALLIFLSLLVAGGERIAAQGSTPQASPTPSGCTIDPLPITFIAELLAAPKPDPEPTAMTDVPRGQPVDAGTASDIEDVIKHLTACTNAGDYLRAFALFDQEYLRRIIDPEGLMTEEVALELGKEFADVTPAQADQLTTLIGIDSIEFLADGTVIALFKTSVGDDDPQTDMLAFQLDGGEWLIVDGKSDITA